MASGYVLRQRGEPQRFTSGKRHWSEVHYTYSVKVVFGHHLTNRLTGDPGSSARVFPSLRDAQRALREVGPARWLALSLATAQRDQAEVDAINVERRAKREAYERAVLERDQARLDVLDAIRRVEGTTADLHAFLAAAEAAEVAARDPEVPGPKAAADPSEPIRITEEGRAELRRQQEALDRAFFGGSSRG